MLLFACVKQFSYRPLQQSEIRIRHFHTSPFDSNDSKGRRGLRFGLLKGGISRNGYRHASLSNKEGAQTCLSFRSSLNSGLFAR